MQENEPTSLILARSNAARLDGNWRAAQAGYLDILAREPDCADALLGAAICQERAGEWRNAETSWRTLLALRPAIPLAHDRLGLIAYRARNLDLALAHFDQALAIKPDYADALHHRATMLQSLRRYDEALAAFDRYFEQVEPADPWAVYHHAKALKDAGRLTGARQRYRDAMRVLPDNPSIGFSWGLLNLMQGDWETGWRFYELRWQGWDRAGKEAPPASCLPRWQGQAVAAPSGLVVYAEQGLGDTVQFFRFQSFLIRHFDRVRFVVQPALTRLLAASAVPGVDVVARGDGAAQDESGWTHHIPLLSVPGVFGARPDALPGADGYLKASPDAEAFPWLREPAGLRVGLVFQCGKVTSMPGRDVPVETLSPLLNMPGVQWTILQNECRLDRDGLFNIAGKVGDFLDTARAIAGLDLVISVDTSVVHVAGALGKPVWLFNRFESEWRWMHGRITSPWYARMRIFSQAAPGAWAPVIDEMADHLRQLVQDRRCA